MRDTTSIITQAFLAGKARQKGNSSTDGQALFLHGHKIAEKRNGKLWITNAGYRTPTTKERLNALPGVDIHQANFEWFLNGQPWDGDWREV